MILVDPSHMMLKTSPVPDPLSDAVLDIDREMKSVLARTDMTDCDKALEYQQTLNRYLMRVNQYNKRSEPPLKSSFQESKPMEDQVDINKSRLESRLIDTIPKTLREKAKLLLAHIKDTAPLTWNERGEIVSKGEVLQNSNITDLINETVRARKLGEAPRGWSTFSQALRESNVPIDLIGNKSRWFEVKKVIPLPQEVPYKKIPQKRSMSHSPSTQNHSRSRAPSRRNLKDWMSYRI